MPGATTPLWVWVFIVVAIALPCLGLFCALLADLAARPVKRVELADTVIELWVRPWNKGPKAEAIIVPVAPDLRMSAGIAKWARDASANRLQNQALKAAPLPPGEAFVGAGGKYRFGIGVLAVVMDDTKRTTPEWITDAIRRAMKLARGHDARTCVLPDMTDDLLRQPTSITDEQRRETCGPIARAMIEGIIEASEHMEEVKIWVWRKSNVDIYLEELTRLERQGIPGGLAVEAAH